MPNQGADRREATANLLDGAGRQLQEAARRHRAGEDRKRDESVREALALLAGAAAVSTTYPAGGPDSQ